jgi:hypothetical protein
MLGLLFGFGCCVAGLSSTVATAGGRELSRQLLLDASEEVDGEREWDGPPRRYLGVVLVPMGVRSADSELRHDTAAEGDLTPR